VVQSLGGTVAMEFGPTHLRTVGGLEAGTYRRLGPVPGAMFVAYRPETAGDSGAVHSGVSASDRPVVQAMKRAATAARRAVAAIDAGDSAALGQAMDATFDARASVMSLDPAHVEMIDAARSHGASANYTGSGGAVVALAANPDVAHRAEERMRDDLGCRTLRLP
ncbi:hypothetical protein, partial [Ilumatobacter sp.]|uniref:hypothetical protein n=1 Tax=Ilumatobacter sp. TaxID=1967498 RepID=UPI003C53E5C7